MPFRYIGNKPGYTRSARRYKKRFATQRGSYKFTRTRGKKTISTGQYSINILPTIMPERYACKLRYCETVTLNPAQYGLAVTSVFRANDLYDPNSAIGGHQPMGFDQLQIFYNHFIVTGSKIRMTPVNEGTANSDGCYYGIALTDQGNRVAGMSMEAIMENDNTTKAIRRVGQLQATTGTITGRATAKKYFSLKKFFNVKSVDGDEFKCSGAGSPTEQAFYECFYVAPSTTSGDPAAQAFFIQLDYIVICHEPVFPLAQS